LQCVAVCCSVLQCVAVCCSVYVYVCIATFALALNHCNRHVEGVGLFGLIVCLEVWLFRCVLALDMLPP